MTGDEAMNILVLCERLDSPGPGSYATDLSRSLSERGHRVFLITATLPGDEGPPGLHLPVRLCRHLSAWGVGGVMRRWLMSELRAFGPDVVHAVVPQLAPVAWRLARKLGAPGLVTVHSGSPEDRRWGAGDLRGCSIIAAGQSVREDLVNQLRIRKARITVIYPGVRAWPGTPPQPLTGRRTTVVGTLGALDYAEGHRLLLRATRLVLDRGLDMQLLIAGTGSEKHDLRELITQLDLQEAVTFVDDISRPRELIQVMDVFVLPTTHGGMSPVVLEAMALGKPVVVSGAGGIFAAVRHNHTGLVFPRGDVPALAAALVRLMLKPDVAARLARQGRELVREEFALDRMVDKTVQLYRRLVEERLAAHAGGPARTLEESD
ncbi:MAG TPA: glycosyltransferase family 4 protein [Planctomycetota bacterium]|nr:glycosyltransferase family 4 protein [Planctomycetota bacterium]